jgi:thiamine pyrophosphate-dependent acetolactate synthase large subunit-like protein
LPLNSPKRIRRSSCEKLSDAQVAKIEARRRTLNLTREKLLERFDQFLKEAGFVYDGLGAAKMRLDRVLNPRMRRPISESTKVALAQALGWTIAQFEKALSGNARQFAKRERGRRENISKTNLKQSVSARQIALAALVQIETYQIGRGVDLAKDNLSRVYAAAYRMFGRIRELMSELPVDELDSNVAARQIYETFNNILNKTLRPHLTKWPERYEEWREASIKTRRNRRLSAQDLQRLFPHRRTLVRELKQVAKSLQKDARKLRSLIFGKKGG